MWNRLFRFFQPLSVIGRRPSSSLSTGFVMALRGDWAIFYHAGSGWIGRGKIPLNTLPLSGIEPGPGKEQTGRYIHSPTELSWPGPCRRQTVRYIHSPTELYDCYNTHSCFSQMNSVVVLVIILATAQCYPSGAPNAACDTLLPGHNVLPQTSQSPYILKCKAISNNMVEGM